MDDISSDISSGEDARDSWDEWMGEGGPAATTGVGRSPGPGATAAGSAPVVCGTLRYVAPEVLHDLQAPGCPADVYGIGVVLLELLAGPSCVESGAVQQDRGCPVTALALVKQCSPLAQDMVRGLLEGDPGARLTARGALEHAWLASMADTCTVGE